jgi:ubiquinone/menaquinone biosynthesis C-methylase UbiE
MPCEWDFWEVTLLAMAKASNPCAGSFGALYDLYIERERLAASIGRVVWGIDTSKLYASIRAMLEPLGNGETILDVPCGGGVAFRGLRPGQNVRYVAADLSATMLDRARRRAAKRSLKQIETVVADMQALPFEDGFADVCLSYSGLHAVSEPRLALEETVRCLRPGGELAGSTFLAEGSRRQRLIFEAGRRRGAPVPSFTSRDLRGWLADAGIASARVEPDTGFTIFGGSKQS